MWDSDESRQYPAYSTLGLLMKPTLRAGLVVLSNKATGQRVQRCLCSVQALWQGFSSVDPREAILGTSEERRGSDPGKGPCLYRFVGDLIIPAKTNSPKSECDSAVPSTDT